MTLLQCGTNVRSWLRATGGAACGAPALVLEQGRQIAGAGDGITRKDVVQKPGEAQRIKVMMSRDCMLTSRHLEGTQANNQSWPIFGAAARGDQGGRAHAQQKATYLGQQQQGGQRRTKYTTVCSAQVVNILEQQPEESTCLAQVNDIFRSGTPAR